MMATPAARRVLLIAVAMIVGLSMTARAQTRRPPIRIKRPKINYDERQVPKYKLPDPLVAADGSKVADAATWRKKRRPEVLELFREHVYGRVPKGKVEVTATLKPAVEVFDGLATRSERTLKFSGGPTIHLLVYRPTEEPGAVPAFMALNFGGNHTIADDPGISLSKSWVRNDLRSGIENNRATDAARGKAKRRWPVKKIVERGYALITAHYADIDPDFDDNFRNGVHLLLDKKKRPPDAWGSIAAWAWGLSRMLDHFETSKDIDAKRIALLGHSRLGKTALWAGANDERFALVISNNSGCGGAALNRRAFGETVGIINRRFTHWFNDNFQKYNEKESDLPVDQHMLVALIAPRPVYVASAKDDRWADPRGEFLACVGAHPVYQLLGTEGLPVKKMPAVDKPVHGQIGYHIRSGRHDVTAFDWNQYLDFADKHLKKK